MFEEVEAHEGGKVVSPTHRPPLPPADNSGVHFYYRLSRHQEYSAAGKAKSIKKIPKTPPGNEPAIFRFVSQCLKWGHRVAPFRYYIYNFIRQYIPKIMSVCDQDRNPLHENERP